MSRHSCTLHPLHRPHCDSPHNSNILAASLSSFSWCSPHLSHLLFPLHVRAVCPIIWPLKHLICLGTCSLTLYVMYPKVTLFGRFSSSNSNSILSLYHLIPYYLIHLIMECNLPPPLLREGYRAVCVVIPCRSSASGHRTPYSECTKGQSQENYSLDKLIGSMEASAKHVPLGPADCRWGYIIQFSLRAVYIPRYMNQGADILSR